MAIAGDLSMAVEKRAGNYSASMGRCVVLAVGEMLIILSLGTWINEAIASALALLCLVLIRYLYCPVQMCNMNMNI